MIQFNLLPDVKLDYIKARRTKRQVVGLAFIISCGALALVVLLFLAVGVFQKKHIKDLHNDIQSSIKQLKDTPDLDKILTIQNQLNTLNDLHDKKPATTKLSDYLPKITPNTLTISSFDIDFDQNTITIAGDADSITTINKFVDTLKFTKYQATDSNDSSNSKDAFNNVVLGSFSLSDNSNGGTSKASYSITLKFDPAIFDRTQGIQLNVPKQITTRSETEKPTQLFDTQPKKQP